MRNCFLFVQYCFLLVLPSLAVAQTDIEYFQAKVPVSSQTNKERRAAAEKGLERVILRVSGSSATVNDPAVQSSVKNALNYVEQFRYLPLRDDSLIQQGYRELLSLSFSPEVVKKVLMEAKQPYWPVNRPKTLLWLVEDTTEEGRLLVNNQGPVPVIDALQRAAYERGIPLIFPLLDLDDQLALSPDDVWEFDEESLIEASARYNADIILVGRYSSDSRGDVRASWQFFHDNAARTYDSRININDEDAMETVGREAVYPLADFLAARYAIVSTAAAQSKLVMQISNVLDFGDYYSAVAYLNKIAAIARVEMVSVQEDTILLYVNAESSVEKLVNALALDGKMKPREFASASNDIPVWQQMPLGSFENPLNYVWVN